MVLLPRMMTAVPSSAAGAVAAEAAEPCADGAAAGIVTVAVPEEPWFAAPGVAVLWIAAFWDAAALSGAAVTTGEAEACAVGEAPSRMRTAEPSPEEASAGSL